MELLCVSPTQLTFYAPYDQVQRRILTLLNPTDTTVLFKVKSNAVRHYGLMPSAGKVDPYDTTEIRISLRCFDFQADQEYRHKFIIQSFYKPNNCFNGENPLAIFRRLHREEIFVKILPVRLEPKPLSWSGLNSLPCLKQLVMERNQQLRPLCPNCPERQTGALKPAKPSGTSIISVVVILVCVLGVVLIAYLQRKQMTEVVMNFYSGQMDCSQDSLLSPEFSCINST